MAIRDIAIRCLEYLDTRTDFWQQQKPMYSRKRDKKMREGARSSASNKDPTNYVLNALEKIDEGKDAGLEIIRGKVLIVCMSSYI